MLVVCASALAFRFLPCNSSLNDEVSQTNLVLPKLVLFSVVPQQLKVTRTNYNKMLPAFFTFSKQLAVYLPQRSRRKEIRKDCCSLTQYTVLLYSRYRIKALTHAYIKPHHSFKSYQKIPILSVQFYLNLNNFYVVL